MQIHLGLDDIDSPSGGCTTHFASLLVKRLEKLGVNWLDYPNLIRLNPNIPFRTRGNGAVCLRFVIESELVSEVMPIVQELLQRYTATEYANTNPGVVLMADPLPASVFRIADMAIWRAVPKALVNRLLSHISAEVYSLGNGRGLIGAIAAVGSRLLNDHTYEYLAYRRLEEHSTDRHIDIASVFEMDRLTSGQTFSNVDPATGSILIAPHGPDPVLFGIRGESPQWVKAAAQLIRLENEVSNWMIFRTNQGTGAHLTHQVPITQLRPYMAARVQGTVIVRPRIIEGGHVVFTLCDNNGQIDCTAYEPSGEFREIVQRLIVGDIVEVHAGVRPASRTHGMTLNIEGLHVIRLEQQRLIMNPHCPDCGRRLTSAGNNKGFKCKHCGLRVSKAEREVSIITRNIHENLYLPPPRAQRHLTRPICRLGRSNNFQFPKYEFRFCDHHRWS